MGWLGYVLVSAPADLCRALLHSRSPQGWLAPDGLVASPSDFGRHRPGRLLAPLQCPARLQLAQARAHSLTAPSTARGKPCTRCAQPSLLVSHWPRPVTWASPESGRQPKSMATGRGVPGVTFAVYPTDRALRRQSTPWTMFSSSVKARVSRCHVRGRDGPLVLSVTLLLVTLHSTLLLPHPWGLPESRGAAPADISSPPHLLPSADL